MQKLVLLATLALSGVAHAAPELKGAESIATVTSARDCPPGELAVVSSWHEAPGNSLVTHVQDAGPSVFCAKASQVYPNGTSVVVRVNKHGAFVVRQKDGTP